jgi:hypothetical protein
VEQTFFRGTSSGPSGISDAFVPGRIRREAPSLKLLAPKMPCWLGAVAVGDFGPSWSSAIGGGLGRRGELDGDAAMVSLVWLTVGGRELNRVSEVVPPGRRG